MKLVIVGKIDLPDKIELNSWNTQFERVCSHFRQRLKERYNIDIGIKLYKLLCKEKLFHQKSMKDSVKYGFIVIDNTPVLVVKRPDKLLITALPINYEIEQPKTL